MKYLLITFLLFSFNSHACSNWISVSELALSQKGEPAKAGCKEGEKCFCYEGINLKDAKVGMKSVDDETKPIYEEDPELGRVLVGYEQKQVEGLIVDEQKKQARLEREAQKEAELEAKKKKKEMQELAKKELLKFLTEDELGNPLSAQEIKSNAKALEKIMKENRNKK